MAPDSATLSAASAGISIAMIWTATTSKAMKAAAGQAFCPARVRWADQKTPVIAMRPDLDGLLQHGVIPQCEAELWTLRVEFEIGAVDEKIEQPVREHDGRDRDGGGPDETQRIAREQGGTERPGDDGGKRVSERHVFEHERAAGQCRIDAAVFDACHHERAPADIDELCARDQRPQWCARFDGLGGEGSSVVASEHERLPQARLGAIRDGVISERVRGARYSR
jgi:hypothetical protein